MKNKKWIPIGLVTLLMMFSGNRVFAEDIVLNEEIVKRYMVTFPEFWRITKELEKASKIKNEDEKNEKISALVNEKEELLKANKWEDTFQYSDTGARILQINIQLNVKGIFEKLQDERNPKAMAAIKKLQEELGHQPEEIIAVLKHNSEINKMYVKAGLRKK